MSAHSAAPLMRAVALAYLAVGLLWATAAFAPAGLPGHLMFDLLDWPLDGEPTGLGRAARWTSAVGAGLLVGFALLLMLVVAPALERGDAGVVRGTTVALLGWFVVDSAGSVASGVWSNALWNVPFLLLALGPLWLARERDVAGVTDVRAGTGTIR